MESLPTDNPEPADPCSTPARAIARTLGLAAVGLGMMAISAGSAWLIRGRLERDSTEPAPAAVVESGAQAHPSPRGGETTRFKVGRLAYRVHCARCHGPEGRGDGADSAVLRPPPRDFATRPWSHGESAEAIRSVILQGVPGTAMTGWSHLLSAEQLNAVVEYVRSFAPPPEPKLANTKGIPSSLLSRAGFEPSLPAAAPAIAVQDLDGRDRSWAQNQDKATLLVFWGTTCAPCLEELPSLERLAAELGEARLAVLPICVDESDASLVREVARTRAKQLPLYLDRTGLARLRYDVQTLPCAVLIDREGRLIGRSQGGKDWSTEAVKAALRAVAAAGDQDSG